MSNAFFGIVIPAAVFVFAYCMTHILYKHFSGDRDE